MYVRVVQPITKYRNLLMVLDVSLIKDVREQLQIQKLCLLRPTYWKQTFGGNLMNSFY